jgi:pimeloyl-ACP methyl ester carboxylesterase
LAEVHLLNFTGHGGKSLPVNFSIPLFADDVLHYLDAHDIQKTNIFGYSMGGYVALHFALVHPSRVENIITLGTKFNWSPSSAQKDVDMMQPDLIEKKVPAFANVLEKRHAPRDWKTIMSETAAMMQEMGKGDHLKKSDFLRISQEVLINIGSEDHMVSIRESEEVAAYLPKGKLRILGGVKHPIETVDKSTLAEIILEEIHQ